MSLEWKQGCFYLQQMEQDEAYKTSHTVKIQYPDLITSENHR